MNIGINTIRETKRSRAVAIMAALVIVVLAFVGGITYYYVTKPDKPAAVQSGLSQGAYDQICEDVSSAVLDSLEQSVVTEVVTKQIDSCITDEELERIFKEYIDKTGEKLTEEQKKEVVNQVRTSIIGLGLVGEESFTEKQKEMIRLIVNRAVASALDEFTFDPVSSEATNIDIEGLQEELESSLTAKLQDMMKKNTYKLSQADIDKIKKELALEDIIASAIGKSDVVTEDGLANIKKDIYSELKADILSAVKTPVKGIDYFTTSEINQIVNDAASKAGKDISGAFTEIVTKVAVNEANINHMQNDVNGVQSDVNGVKSDVNGVKNDVNGVKEDMNIFEKALAGIKDSIKNNGPEIATITTILSNGGTDGLAGVLSTIDGAATVGAALANLKSDTDLAVSRLSVLEAMFGSRDALTAVYGDDVDPTAQNNIFGVIGAIWSRVGGIQEELGENTLAIKANADALKETNESLEQAQIDLAQGMQNLKDSKENLEKAIQDGDEEVIAAAVEKVKENNEALQKIIQNVADSDLNIVEKATAQAMADAVQNALDAYEASNDATVQEISDAIGQLEIGINSLINANTLAIKANAQAIQALQADVGANTEKIKENIEKLKQTNESLEQTQKDLEDGMKDLENAKKNLEKAIQDGDDDVIKAATDEVREKTEALQAIIDNVADSDLNATEKATAQAMADAVMDALNTYQQNNDGNIQGISDAIDALDESVNGLINANALAIKTNSSAISSLQAQVGENAEKIQQNIDDLEQTNEDLEKTQKDLEDGMKDLANAKKNLEKAIQDGDEDVIKAAEDAVREKAEALQAIIDNVADSDLNATEKATAQAMADAVMDALNTYQQNNDGNIQGISDAIDALDESVNGLIDANTSAIETNTNAISSLNTAMGSAGETSGTVWGNINDLHATVKGMILKIENPVVDVCEESSSITDNDNNTDHYVVITSSMAIGVADAAWLKVEGGAFSNNILSDIDISYAPNNTIRFANYAATPDKLYIFFKGTTAPKISRITVIP